MDLKLPRTVIFDPKLAFDDIVGNHRAQDIRSQFDLRLVLLKFATAHEDVSSDGLHGGAAFVVVIPVAKRAIGKTDRAPPGDFRDLIARPPERAIDKPHRASIVLLHIHHRGIRSMKCSEFTIADQQAERSGLLDGYGSETIVGSNAQEISVALAAGCVDKS